MYRLQKVFSFGNVINPSLYFQLQELDKQVFVGASDEFKQNREWWVIQQKGNIIAYCGSLYSQGVCIFVRAWVARNHRGKGLQRKMIKTRLKAAKGCYRAITYVYYDNANSINNLIKEGFLTYNPEYQYAGSGFIYWGKDL